MIRFFLPLCFLISCSPRIQLHRQLVQAEVEFQDHIGLLVYDPITRKSIVDFNSQKYFTPASNTKIFTLLSSLHLIGDSIPSLRYVERGDSLIFWGTGDPSFLYDVVFQNPATYNFLKDNPKSLYFSASNFYQQHFGPGWAWDDYNYGFSPERSSFPIYGNCLRATDSINGHLKVTPELFQDSVTVINTVEKRTRLIRDIDNNELNYFVGADSNSFARQVPFHVNPILIARLIQDTLHRQVTLVNNAFDTSALTLHSVPSDSLYKIMMQESDNFIAEQLLQLCAGIISDSLKSEIAIKFVKKNLLFDLPDEPQWVDGSGLSRYNLFTPRSVVRLWEKIMVMVPQERLFKLLAIGGRTGTINNSFKDGSPYVFGKTGTLSNNHNLSGYLVTQKGRLFIFSYMNNNYTVKSTEVKKQMEAVLSSIHERY